MSKPDDRTDDRHGFPAVHALHLVHLIARWGVEPDDVLAGTNLCEADLADPARRIAVETLTALIERARALTGEAGLGFYMGLQMRISSHGYLGFAAMTAGTVREALEIVTRFAPIRSTALEFTVREQGTAATLRLEERADFGPARDALVIALLVGIWQIGNALTGRALTGRLDLAFDEPEYFARFAPSLPGAVRFGQAANALVFDASVLALPLTQADPAAMRLAREQCERELDALGYDADLRARVRALAARPDGAGFRTLEEIAAVMHVSARTLKRRLAARGTAYSTLLEDQRRERALEWLRDADASLESVAARLGYSDVANFTRAFRRWTGTTPGAFRRRGG